jgi:iron-sulfur cluster insertion protein
VFTDSAASKVKQPDRRRRRPGAEASRVRHGGRLFGASSTGFTFDKETSDDDTTLVKGGVTLLIDPMSLQYLTGAEIDYQENIEGAQFVIKNPNATSTCGCGSSFSA